jgi:predicted transcriptional regulator
MPVSNQPATFLIDDPAQIKALQSPMRQEIIDALTALGPSSIQAIGEHLGRAADSLYFHVKKLVKVKLVQCLEKRKNGRHEWAIYAVPGRVARIVYQPKVAKSIKKVVAGAMRLSLREFQQSIVSDAACYTGSQRNVWGGRVKGWLSPEELAEVNRLLEQLLSVFHQHKQTPEASRQVYSMAWVFAPVPARSRDKKKKSTPRRKTP